MEETKFLRNELEKRIQKNPRYSMRSFSKVLGVNVGTLSSILSGKRRLTPKMALRFCDNLDINFDERETIVETIAAHQGSLSSRTRGYTPKKYLDIEQDRFRVIADWYHYGILTLIKTSVYEKEAPENSAAWFAKKLDITELEAFLACERMCDLGLIKKDGQGLYFRTFQNLGVKDRRRSSSALRQWQKQIREKAIESIEKHPIDKRVITSVSMAIDPAKIDEARGLIEEFQERMSNFLEKGTKESAYQMAVSLFPLEAN